MFWERCGSTAPAIEQEISMNSKRTVIAISAAMALGIVGAATVAQANDSGENNRGGFVIPGSTVGVNPAYHPGWFGKSGSAGNSYGYAPVSIQKQRAAQEQDQRR
jgi:hypothetical protein